MNSERNGSHVLDSGDALRFLVCHLDDIPTPSGTPGSLLDLAVSPFECDPF